jgi:hypothetical protein
MELPQWIGQPDEPPKIYLDAAFTSIRARNEFFSSTKVA